MKWLIRTAKYSPLFAFSPFFTFILNCRYFPFLGSKRRYTPIPVRSYPPGTVLPHRIWTFSRMAYCNTVWDLNIFKGPWDRSGIILQGTVTSHRIWTLDVFRGTCQSKWPPRQGHLSSVTCPNPMRWFSLASLGISNVLATVRHRLGFQQLYGGKL